MLRIVFEMSATVEQIELGDQILVPEEILVIASDDVDFAPADTLIVALSPA
jgi:hypothetical protein